MVVCTRLAAGEDPRENHVVYDVIIAAMSHESSRVRAAAVRMVPPLIASLKSGDGVTIRIENFLAYMVPMMQDVSPEVLEALGGVIGDIACVAHGMVDLDWGDAYVVDDGEGKGGGGGGGGYKVKGALAEVVKWNHRPVRLSCTWCANSTVHAGNALGCGNTPGLSSHAVAPFFGLLTLTDSVQSSAARMAFINSLGRLCAHCTEVNSLALFRCMKLLVDPEYEVRLRFSAQIGLFINYTGWDEPEPFKELPRAIPRDTSLGSVSSRRKVFVFNILTSLTHTFLFLTMTSPLL